MQKSTIPQPHEPSHKKEGWRGFLSLIMVFAGAFLIAVTLNTFVFQSYEVEGLSMQETLHDKDRLIILKTGKTWARITHNTFVPKRGDIVVFSRPTDLNSGHGAEKHLIKRVVGLPGERVVVKDGMLKIFNKEHPEGFEPDTQGQYTIQSASTLSDNDIDITVPEGQVFVCGDNRGNSMDSRSFGPISTSDIVGTLALRILPLSKIHHY